VGEGGADDRRLERGNERVMEERRGRRRPRHRHRQREPLGPPPTPFLSCSRYQRYFLNTSVAVNPLFLHSVLATLGVSLSRLPGRYPPTPSTTSLLRPTVRARRFSGARYFRATRTHATAKVTMARVTPSPTPTRTARGGTASRASDTAAGTKPDRPDCPRALRPRPFDLATGGAGARAASAAETNSPASAAGVAGWGAEDGAATAAAGAVSDDEAASTAAVKGLVSSEGPMASSPLEPSATKHTSLQRERGR